MGRKLTITLPSLFQTHFMALWLFSKPFQVQYKIWKYLEYLNIFTFLKFFITGNLCIFTKYFCDQLKKQSKISTLCLFRWKRQKHGTMLGINIFFVLKKTTAQCHSGCLREKNSTQVCLRNPPRAGWNDKSLTWDVYPFGGQKKISYNISNESRYLCLDNGILSMLHNKCSWPSFYSLFKKWGWKYISG